MTATVFLSRLDDQGAKTVSTMGSQPGPVGGDNWTVISRLPTSRLLSSRHYAFWVTGRIGNVRVNGTTPTNGRMQICLGDASGTKSPLQLTEFGASDNLPFQEGIPFAFLLIFSASPSVVDPVWGAVWPNTADLQLLGRTYWDNDPRTYSVDFDITDLVWMWSDLDSVPSGSQLVSVTTYAPGAMPLTTTPWTNLLPNVNSAGGTGETWLHFFSVNYFPGIDAVPAFQAGYVDLSSFNAKHGTNNHWGYGKRGARLGQVQFHQGTFWVQINPTSVNVPTMQGYDRVALTSATTVQRVAVLSLRIDQLPSVHWAASALTVNLTDHITTLFNGARRFPLELVATQRSFTPWVFVTGAVDRRFSQRRAFGAWIDTDDSQMPVFSVAQTQTDGPHEAMAVYGCGSQGLGPSSPGVQYRARFLEIFNSGIFNDVRDIYLLTLYPVKDPDNAPPVIPGVGTPTAIVPGTESLDVSSLSAPPIAPDVATGETPNWQREQLLGITGYRRTWGVFTKPRRSFVLSWGPLTAARRDAVMAFIAANVAWKITPPRELAAVPVVPISRASWRQESAQSFRIDVQVAELIYTGP